MSFSSEIPPFLWMLRVSSYVVRYKQGLFPYLARGISVAGCLMSFKKDAHTGIMGMPVHIRSSGFRGAFRESSNRMVFPPLTRL